MDIKQIIKGSVHKTFKKSGLTKSGNASNDVKPDKKQPVTTEVSFSKKAARLAKALITEALVAMPQSFILNTEKLSETTKKTHEHLYKTRVEAFNKVSAGLDGANKYEANENYSAYRSLKVGENSNLNSIKLHELYFYNIADQASEISVDALPYMKLSRDFGTFENWQFDFMAACKASKNGWGVLVYEPYKNVYMNIVIDGDNMGLPIGAVPVLVMDMFEHAYMHDYEANIDDYIVAMMREVNWNVVEARMVLAEKSELSALYMIKPIYNSAPRDMLAAAGQPPIDQVKNAGGVDVPATTPPQAEENSPYQTDNQ